MTLSRGCLPLLLAAVVATASGCRPTGVDTVTAEVVLSDGTSLPFAPTVRTAQVGDGCALEALDEGRRFGLTFSWTPALFGADRTLALEDPGTPLRLVITRPHPTDPGRVRLSPVTHGVAFVSQATRCDLHGTFDEVLLDHAEPDDTVHIAIHHGVFPGVP